MESIKLCDLNARLVQVELEAKTGSDWFSSWLRLIQLTEGGPVPSGLEHLARRMDAILAAVNAIDAEKQDITVEATKRAIDETLRISSSEPVTKKAPGLQQIAAINDEEVSIPNALAATSVNPSEPDPRQDQNEQIVDASSPTTDPLSRNLSSEKVEEIVSPSVTISPPSPTQSATLASPAPTSKLAAFLQTAETPSMPVAKQVAPSNSPKHMTTTNGSSTTPMTLSDSFPTPSSPVASPKPVSVASPKTSVVPTPSKQPAAPPTPASPILQQAIEPSPPYPVVAPSSPSSIVTPSSNPSEPISVSPLAPSSVSKTSSPPSSPGNSGTVISAGIDTKSAAVKQSEGGHMEVSQECYDLFQEIKIRKKHRYVMFKIDNWKLEISKVGDRNANFEDFLKELPFSDCRYAVYDHERMKNDQYGARKAEKVFFITWQPVPAPTQLKMLYSTERRTLGAVFKGVEEIVAVKRDDILFATGTKDKFAEDDSDDEERGGKDDWMDD